MWVSLPVRDQEFNRRSLPEPTTSFFMRQNIAVCCPCCDDRTSPLRKSLLLYGRAQRSSVWGFSRYAPPKLTGPILTTRDIPFQPDHGTWKQLVALLTTGSRRYFRFRNLA